MSGTEKAVATSTWNKVDRFISLPRRRAAPSRTFPVWLLKREELREEHGIHLSYTWVKAVYTDFVPRLPAIRPMTLVR